MFLPTFKLLMKYKIVLVSFDNNVTFKNQLHLLITACFCFMTNAHVRAMCDQCPSDTHRPRPRPLPSLRTDTPDKLRKKAG